MTTCRSWSTRSWRELADRGIDVRFVVHPVLTVVRDDAGRLIALKDAKTAPGALRESVIYIHLEPIDDEARRADIVAAIERVLADIRLCVADWRAMLKRVEDVIAELETHRPPVPADEIAEAVAFLEWLVDNNFTFLGVRNYQLSAGEEALEPMFETGLGILRSRDVGVVQRWNQPLVITPEIRALLKEPTLLIVTKSAARSRVHRHVYMDYVGVKRFDRGGKLIGEFRIVGLFTSTAYTRSTRTIPYLRRKVDAVLERAGFDPDGHSGKALVNVLESYPRDELFQLDENTLYHFAMAVLQLDERPRVRVLPRRDRFDRYVSVLVYVPRERYDSDVRKAIGEYLAEVYKGRVSAFHPFFPEGPLVRVHFIIALSPGHVPNPDRTSLERAVEEIVRTWTDKLGEELARSYDPERARALLERYRGAFSDGYRENYSPATTRRRNPNHGGAVAGPAARRRFSPSRRGSRQRRWSEGLELRTADPPVRARPRAREHGLQCRGRAHLSDRACRQEQFGSQVRCLASRHVARARGWRRRRPQVRQEGSRGGVPGRDGRRRGERRLQRARAGGRDDVA